MEHTHSDPLRPYQELHSLMDDAIGTFGIEQLCDFLKVLLSRRSQKLDKSTRDRLVATYLQSESVHVFGLSPTGLYKDDSEDYVLARKACYHLINVHTEATYSEIGRLFGRPKQQVYYHFQACEAELEQERLLPRYKSRFLSHYHSLEQRLHEFLQKLV